MWALFILSVLFITREHLSCWTLWIIKFQFSPVWACADHWSCPTRGDTPSIVGVGESSQKWYGAPLLNTALITCEIIAHRKKRDSMRVENYTVQTLGKHIYIQKHIEESLWISSLAILIGRKRDRIFRRNHVPILYLIIKISVPFLIKTWYSSPEGPLVGWHRSNIDSDGDAECCCGSYRALFDSCCSSLESKKTSVTCSFDNQKSHNKYFPFCKCWQMHNLFLKK